MRRPKEDWAEALQFELKRLGVELVTRTIRKQGAEHTLTDRQLALLLRRVGDPGPNGCWQWAGRIAKDRYGRWSLTIGGRTWNFLAHRAAYEILKGSIPDGLTLDHLCRVKACVNPDHLDPCSGAENTARSPFTISSINRAKMTCINGHPLDGTFTRQNGRIDRFCKTCAAEANRRYRQRKRASTKSGNCRPPERSQHSSAITRPYSYRQETLFGDFNGSE